MAVLTTTSDGTQIDQIIAEYWNNRFLSELRDNLMFYDYALKNTHARGQGTMVHWMGITDLTAGAAITEGSDPTEYNLSATDQTATVSQYGASILVSDLLQDTWVAGSYQQLMERLARNAALTLDTIVLNAVITGGGTASYGGTAVARNSIATDGSFDADIAELRKGVNWLEGLKAQTYPDGFYRAVISPDVKYDLQGDSASWQDIVKHTDPSMVTERYAGARGPGRHDIGELFGIRFAMSQLCPELVYSGSACTDVYQSFLFSPEFFGVSELSGVQMIVKNPHPASDLDMYGTVGWKCAFAKKELSSSRMIRIETGASLGT